MSRPTPRGWKPPADLPSARNPRLDPFRRRAGRLTRLDDGSPIGFVFIEVEPASTSNGGALWWRRWGPWRDSLRGYVVVTGEDQIDDFAYWIQEDVEDCITEWGTGRFAWRGDELAVEWLDDAETARVRTEFGFPAEPG